LGGEGEGGEKEEGEDEKGGGGGFLLGVPQSPTNVFRKPTHKCLGHDHITVDTAAIAAVFFVITTTLTYQVLLVPKEHVHQIILAPKRARASSKVGPRTCELRHLW
jgi:hypothetical protein